MSTCQKSPSSDRVDGTTEDTGSKIDTHTPSDSGSSDDTGTPDDTGGPDDSGDGGGPDGTNDPWSADYVVDHTPVAGLELVAVVYDSTALDHVVQSKIYPEDPDVLFLTMRGGGVSTFDISDPANPSVLGGWESSEDVEGQDRKDDLLVVVARSGSLLTFDASDPSQLTLLSELVLDTDASLYEAVVEDLLTLFSSGPFGALHTKLYDAPDGHRYALVTATETGELVAVDVTDPAAPEQVGAIDTEVEFIEGIYIYNDHSFHGGFGSSGVLQGVDISNPAHMSLTDSVSDPAFCQMVSEMKAYIPDVLFAALWEDDGGLGAFDVTDGADISVLDTLTRPELAQSNRVKIFDQIAVLPLEQDPGGVALVDVADPENLQFLGMAAGVIDLTSPYTAEVKDDYLYVFSAEEDAMSVFHIQRAEPEAIYGIWDMGELEDPADLLDGLPASDGVGSLTVVDPDRTASDSTLVKMALGTSAGVDYLQLDGSSGWDERNGLFLEHELEHLFYGSLTSYTIVWDLAFPEDAFEWNGCSSVALTLCNDIALFQLDRTNDNDGELFIKVGSTGFSDNGFIGKTGDPISDGGLDGYTEAISPDTWYRISFVVDLYDTMAQAVIYVNGSPVQQVDQITYPYFSPVAEGNPWATDLLTDPGGFLLFGDNDGEVDAQVRMGSVMFANRSLSAAEVAALGTTDGTPIPAPW